MTVRETEERPKSITVHPEPDTAKWRAKIEHKEKLTIDDAKFLFEQAEKQLNDSVSTSETIVHRMNTIITLVTGSLLALLGYIITRLGQVSFWENGMFTACVGAIYLYALAIYSFINTHPKSYLRAGALPKDMFADSFFTDSIQNEERILLLYLNEIENYQLKTDINNALNDKRWIRYKVTLKYLFCLPPILAGCYAFTT